MTVYYSSLKFLKFKDNLEFLKQGEISAPVHIRVKPTNHCNHHCWYCAYRNDELSLGDEMFEKDSIPASKMFALAHEFVEMGVKAVTFSGGGEPLLYKPLPDVIDVLAAGGVRIAALTNGSNLKGRVADALAKNATWVRISLDAWDDQSYTKSRGAKAHGFSILIDNIQKFTARNSQCVLGISFIVGQENHNKIFEVSELLKNCGVNHVKISGAVVGNDAKLNNAYHRNIKNEVARQISMAESLIDNHFSILNHYHDLQNRFEKHYTTCPSLNFLTVIGADQHVYTCQDKAYTQSGRVTSIAERSFKDYWFSQDNQNFLRMFNPSIQCSHHCVSHAKNLAIHEYMSLDQDHLYFV